MHRPTMIRIVNAYKTEHYYNCFVPREFRYWCFGYINGLREGGVLHWTDMAALETFIETLTRED